MSEATEDPGLPVELPFDGALDLHTFRPQDAAAVVADFLEESARRGQCRVRIIHGKGIGALRETVHAVLARHPLVQAFRLAGGAQGGWGATVVDLRQRG